MKFRFFTCMFLGILYSLTCSAYKCTIRGDVFGRNSKNIILVKTTDLKFLNKQVIPITGNKFSFTFEVKDVELYDLVFEDEYENNVWDAINFFPVDGMISFKLYPENEVQKDEVLGGDLNTEYANYKKITEATFHGRQNAISHKRDSLNKIKLYYNREHDSLIRIMNTVSHENIDRSVYTRLDEMRNDGEGLTPAGKLVNTEQQLLDADKLNFRYQYIGKNPTILSYYLIYKDVYYSKNNTAVIAAARSTYPKFSALYPTHPYTQIIGDLLDGYNKLSPGQQLIDFTLPDLAGNEHSLKQLTNGKITLIDFWGSWCGPCIAASRTMVPVYNEFRDKGFNVIGIAKEYKSTKDLKIALSREKYAWLNLVELDDKHKVWTKYGITNSTGMMLLVDKDGKIIAVDPTAETVKKEILARM